MKIYCTTRNAGPSWHSDALFMKYLGTSIEDAEAVVGDFSRYQKDETHFPIEFPKPYSALPKNIKWEMVRYYSADGWWSSIVMFELVDPSIEESDRCARAYGWEVGYGHPLVKQINELCKTNPFLDPNWRDKLEEA